MDDTTAFYLMLPRTHRIPTKKFPEVTRGKTFMTDSFRVVLKYDDTLHHAHCAVIVPTKIAKTATTRNRIRRQVYEVLGSLITQLPRAWISVFPKQAVMDHAAIVHELGSLFK